MFAFLERLHQFIWGIPALVLIIGVGFYLSFRTGFVQFRFFPKAIRALLQKLNGGTSKDGVSSYQALCTALAATVGTGNLAGVAGAIALGGPGAVFWMWICGILGMMTKYAEATLAIHYRRSESAGRWIGGPMYMIEDGMGKRWKWMAVAYCCMGVVASFGVGNATQINTIIGGIGETVSLFGGNMSEGICLAVGVAFAVLVVIILSGGAKRIGRAAESLVPAASVFYLLLCFSVLILRWDAVDDAFHAILSGAFRPSAVTGGAIGSFFMTLRIGASRGVFTNESGMGTASIAHASAEVTHPAEQGLMGIVEVFLDTIVICTMTALVLLCSGVPIHYGVDTGMVLTSQAFASVLGDWVTVPLSIALCCFAIATILGWGMYGLRCAEYIFGSRAKGILVGAQAVTAVLGSVTGTGLIWMLSDIVNGCMVIPNLVALVWLSPRLITLTKNFTINLGRSAANGGTYENINQCKSVRTLAHAKVSPYRRKSQKSRRQNLSSQYRSA